MTYEEWFAKYRPIKNPMGMTEALDGCMFETYGDELDFVRNHNFYNVWTLCEGDKGLYIGNGYRMANRLGYLLTLRQWKKNEKFEIKLD
jgi:hypothetical protein